MRLLVDTSNCTTHHQDNTAVAIVWYFIYDVTCPPLCVTMSQVDQLLLHFYHCKSSCKRNHIFTI